MRSRLRPPLTPAEQSGMYAKPHRHDQWPDHVMRVKVTIELGEEMLAPRLARGGDSLVIADLSCGDAAIARHLAAGAVRDGNAARVILGDIAPGYEVHGPIEVTVATLTKVSMFICTETIEHLEDPDSLLTHIRTKADMLVLSTPDDEPPGINREHLWSWNQDDVRAMLTAAGWEPFAGRTVSWTDGNGWTWAYQIWGCR